MEETGHLSQEDDRYSITEKGKRNSELCDSSLPYSVRMHCDENLAKVNEALRWEEQVQTDLSVNDDGTYNLHLLLNDISSPLLKLAVLVPDQTTAKQMAQKFQQDPAAFFHGVINLLTFSNPKSRKYFTWHVPHRHQV